MYKISFTLLFTTLALIASSEASEKGFPGEILLTLSKEAVQESFLEKGGKLIKEGWELIDDARKNGRAVDSKAEKLFLEALNNEHPQAIMGLLTYYSGGKLLQSNTVSEIKPEYFETFKTYLEKSIQDKKTTVSLQNGEQSIQTKRDLCLERDEGLYKKVLEDETKYNLIKSGIDERSFAYAKGYYGKVSPEKAISHYGAMAKDLEHKDSNIALKELLNFKENREAQEFLVQAYIARKDSAKAGGVLQELAEQLHTHTLQNYIYDINKFNTDLVLAFKLLMLMENTKFVDSRKAGNYVIELEKLKRKLNVSLEKVDVKDIDGEILKAKKQFFELSKEESTGFFRVAQAIMNDKERDENERFSRAALFMWGAAQDKEVSSSDYFNEIIKNPQLIDFLDYDEICRLFMQNKSIEGLKLLKKKDPNRAPLLLFFLNDQKFKDSSWAWKKGEELSNLDLIQWEDSTKLICDAALQGYIPAMIFYSEFIEAYLKKQEKSIDEVFNLDPQLLKSLEEQCQIKKREEQESNEGHSFCFLCDRIKDVTGKIISFEEGHASTKYGVVLPFQEAQEHLKSLQKILHSNKDMERKIKERLSGLTEEKRLQLKAEFEKTQDSMVGLEIPIFWSKYEKEIMEASGTQKK